MRTGGIKPPDRISTVPRALSGVSKVTRAFTLIELLVVLVIALTVSALALPSLVSGFNHRQASEAARILSGALTGARDQAIKDNSPSGLRLIPDGTLANCYSSVIPLSTPPNYSVGLASCFPMQSYPATVTLGTLALVLEESPTYVFEGVTLPNESTSWFWNVRVGDKIQINQAGPWYTVCGPMVQANNDGFANFGVPGTLTPLGHEFLLLTNGRDDNQDGWIDNGWDGVDNNGDGIVDNLGAIDPTDATLGEWEREAWVGDLQNGTTNASYVIRRRPAPGINARATALPTNVVVDMLRSNMPSNALLPAIDVTVQPNGSMVPGLLYSTPASISMGSSYFQFWLSERSDVGLTQPLGNWYLITANGRTGLVTSLDQPDLVTGLNDGRKGVQ